MINPARHSGIDISPDDVARLVERYERGLYLQAYEHAMTLGPMHEWRGTEARLIAGRLAGNLGSRKIANWLHLRAWLADRTSPEAAYFCAYAIVERRGPMAGWKFLERLPKSFSTPEKANADLFTLRAHLLGVFRDFERAEQLLDEAGRIGAQPAWLWCERASLLSADDRYETALAAVQTALQIRPWYRPAVQQVASLLQLLNRDEEAANVLTESFQHIESGHCAVQLSSIHAELGRHAEAAAMWETSRKLLPMLEEDAVHGWHGRMSQLQYLAGHRQSAAEHARATKDDAFSKAFAERLEDPNASTSRVHLLVGFVRQHHVTCAPATLTAIATYFGQAVDHLALARQITYDGTPDHVERAWATENGFIAREFRVTWEAAVALLDRGVPFTLTTTEITTGHLQAAIGYDAMRQTLIIRDPYQRHHGEFCIEPFLERYAPFGPRGMVLLPASEAHRIDGLALPDAEYFDVYYDIRRALHIHDRGAAGRALEKLEQMDPEHRLTLFAQRDLAYYDSQIPRQLATQDALLQRYPDCGSFLLGKSYALRELALKSEHTAFLKDLAARDVDPLFWREWATELALDARRRPDARRQLLRALRYRPADPDQLSALANLMWDERQFGAATELYRFAACLRETTDGPSRTYFLASRHIHETEAALKWLRQRLARHGEKSSLPARSLFWALNVLDRAEEAFEVLEKALSARPDDGELLLHAADAFARRGQMDRAEMLLQSAAEKAARAAWLRTAANLAGYRCDPSAALALWETVIEAEPLASDAQRTVMQLLAEVHGRASTLARLETMAEQFPSHAPLHRLWVEWARLEGAEHWEKIARRALTLNPDDPWLRRELALALLEGNRVDESLVEADAAVAMEPQNPASHATRGSVLEKARRPAEARASYEAALRLSIDFVSAMNDLLGVSASFEEKHEAARFIRAEMVRQVVFGEGLLAFREMFFTVLAPEEMLAAMREAYEARRDLWQAWAALIRQLVDMRRLDEAFDFAREASLRFPLVPGAWVDLALVQRHRGLRPEEIEALQRALALNPAWGTAARELASALDIQAGHHEAERVLEKAIAASPLDAQNHAQLADLLYRRGRRKEAIDRVILAVKHEPGHDWAWQNLRDWTTREGEPDRAVEIARELTVTRPGEARSWYRLAQMIPPEKTDEVLAAVDRAIGLAPEFIDAHHLRAIALTSAARFEEALASCRPASFGNQVPIALRARVAWIEAARGHRDLALEQMRAIVKDAPDFYWGWSKIAEWAFDLNRAKESLEAAETLARLAPRSAIPLGFLANAYWKLGQRKDAFASLERAFDLDPTYEFAGYTLFDHYLEERTTDRAEAILARLRIHLPGSKTDAAAIRFEARMRHEEAALAAFRKLCFCPEDEGFCIRIAAAALTDAEWRSKMGRIIGEVLTEPGVNPEVGALWVEHFTSTAEWDARQRFAKIDPKTPVGHRARESYLSAVGSYHKVSFLEKILAKERDVIRASTKLWAQVGYAYVANQRWREAVSWMDDWQGRRDVEPWMLSNLAYAFRQLDRDADALAVHEFAVTLHGDGTTAKHHSWLALNDALRGNLDQAQQHIVRAQLHPDPDDQLSPAVYAMANAIVAVSIAAPERRGEVFSIHREILRQNHFANAFAVPMLKEYSRTGIEIMAKAANEKPFRLSRRRGSSNARSSGEGGFNPLWLAWIGVVLVAQLARCGSMNTSNSRPDWNSSRTQPRAEKSFQTLIPEEEVRQQLRVTTPRPSDDRVLPSLQPSDINFDKPIEMSLTPNLKPPSRLVPPAKPTSQRSGARGEN